MHSVALSVSLFAVDTIEASFSGLQSKRNETKRNETEPELARKCPEMPRKQTGKAGGNGQIRGQTRRIATTAPELATTETNRGNRAECVRKDTISRVRAATETDSNGRLLALVSSNRRQFVAFVVARREAWRAAKPRRVAHRPINAAPLERVALTRRFERHQASSIVSNFLRLSTSLEHFRHLAYMAKMCSPTKRLESAKKKPKVTHKLANYDARQKFTRFIRVCGSHWSRSASLELNPVCARFESAARRACCVFVCWPIVVDEARNSNTPTTQRSKTATRPSFRALFGLACCAPIVAGRKSRPLVASVDVARSLCVCLCVCICRTDSEDAKLAKARAG